MQQHSHIRETISLVQSKSQKDKHEWMYHELNTAAQDVMKMNVAKTAFKISVKRERGHYG